MKRMSENSLDGKIHCPICQHTVFSKSHRESTPISWVDSFFGIFGMNREILPERIELYCLKCGYTSYVLPSDMMGRW